MKALFAGQLFGKEKVIKMTGTISTWVIGLLLFGAFVYGVRRIYRTAKKGDCCGSGGCSGGCPHCHTKDDSRQH